MSKTYAPTFLQTIGETMTWFKKPNRIGGLTGSIIGLDYPFGFLNYEQGNYQLQ